MNSDLKLTSLPAEEFCARAGPFMALREAENGLPWGIARRLAANPDPQKRALFLTVESGTEVVAAAVWTPPHEVVVTHLPQGTAALIASRCVESGWLVTGVLGPANSGSEIAAQLALITGDTVAVRMRQRVYELVTINPVPRTSGAMRQADESDVALVATWCDEFTREAGLPMHDDLKAWAKAVIAAGSAFLWEDATKPRSLACLSRETPNGRSIGPVYTPPEERRRGYATSLVASLSQYVLTSGKRFAVLFTDADNPTSNHIYETIGFRFVCNYDAYTLKASSSPS